VTNQNIKVRIPLELERRLVAIATAGILGATVDEVIVHFTREALHRDWLIQPPVPGPSAQGRRPPALPSDQPPTASSTPRVPEQNSRRLLRIPDVCRQTGLGKSSIYAMIQSGLFPAPKRLGYKAVAWLQSDVNAWIDSR
jgi:prophage regulatory protein